MSYQTRRAHQPHTLSIICIGTATKPETGSNNFQTQLAQIEPVDVVINLCGRSVDCVKTPENCDAILRSRVDSTRCLRRVFAAAAQQPHTWLQMSTAHIYGDPAQQVIDEDGAYGFGLAPTVGQAWEAACHDHPVPGCRDVVMRTSFVLGRDGGAFPTLVWLTRLGLGGRIGHGRQGLSWIHIDDVCGFVERAINNSAYRGVYNLTAPHPVSQMAFMRAIRRCNKHMLALPSPAFLVRMGSWLMRRDPDLALTGRYCVSRRIPEADFAYPTIDAAIQQLKPRFLAGWGTP